jgi:hypothetical protein
MDVEACDLISLELARRGLARRRPTGRLARAAEEVE